MADPTRFGTQMDDIPGLDETGKGIIAGPVAIVSSIRRRYGSRLTQQPPMDSVLVNPDWKKISLPRTRGIGLP